MRAFEVYRRNVGFILAIAALIVTGVIILRSVAPLIFPGYYFYIVLGLIVFLLFSQLDLEILKVFSGYFYV